MIPSESLIIWPDGSWCYVEELHEFSHKSDDWRVICPDDERYQPFIEANS